MKNDKENLPASLSRFLVNDMKENILIGKSIDFGARIVKLYRYLSGTKKENILSKQILRSGTSIGANINEAQYAITKKDFLNKMYIAFKECAETQYWIQLLYRTDYLSDAQYKSIIMDCEELNSLLSSITKSTRESK